MTLFKPGDIIYCILKPSIKWFVLTAGVVTIVPINEDSVGYEYTIYDPENWRLVTDILAPCASTLECSK